VVGGWALVQAATQMGLTEVPAVSLTDLPEAEARALRLALNRLGEDAAWDREALAIELSEVLELAPEIDLEISGFETDEIGTLLDPGGHQDDELPPIDVTATPATQPGDLWVLGDHRVFCGDALSGESYERVLGGEKAEMIFADPRCHVAKLGTIKQGNFTGASGEVSSAQLLTSLKTFFGYPPRTLPTVPFISFAWIGGMRKR
jgi:hypothetical protein